MPRNPEKNALVREARRKQILDAALTVYIRFGYHGTDMDAVAEEAQLAKGLLYYYYKTKKELFAELYTWMYHESYSFSATLLDNTEGRNPVEQLMYYTYGMFGASNADLRLMQFSMRVPFDAYAIFGPEKWKEGAQNSDMHRKALANIIERGMEQGLIPKTNPSSSANSFWSVFVANVFEYSRLMTGDQVPHKSNTQVFKDVVQFCFQGLGIEYSTWNACLETVVSEKEKGSRSYENL